MMEARSSGPKKRKKEISPQALSPDEASICGPRERTPRRILPERACARLCILRLKACASVADEHLRARLKRDENAYRQQQKARLLPSSKEAWTVAYKKVVSSIKSGEGARIVLRKPQCRPEKPIQPKPLQNRVRRRSIHELLPGEWRVRIVLATRDSGVEDENKNNHPANSGKQSEPHTESAAGLRGSGEAPGRRNVTAANHSSSRDEPEVFHRWYWCPRFDEAEMLFSRALDYLRGYLGVDGYPRRTEAQVAQQVIAVLRYTYRFTLTYDHRLELICKRLSWETLKREAGSNALPPRVEAVAIGAPPLDILVEAEKERARLKAASRAKHFLQLLRPWSRAPLTYYGDTRRSGRSRAAVSVSSAGKRPPADVSVGSHVPCFSLSPHKRIFQKVKSRATKAAEQTDSVTPMNTKLLHYDKPRGSRRTEIGGTHESAADSQSVENRHARRQCVRQRGRRSNGERAVT
ncbi:hypothetical protein TGVAND_221840 [Toxoplasma gondii VAND]|uniref:Uncharacterized protein n=1 Tax=Toxoplasma gondii VAND TaxID=933077 RepID=A0A086PTH4_TOXGO|nr:hypothetical protein TGVAND_221840 [Toxoplasma gondii VAND]